MPVKIIIKEIRLGKRQYPKAVYERMIANIRVDLKKKVAPLIQDAMGKRVKNWTHKPKFRYRSAIKAYGLRLDVYPAENKERWVWVSGGTEEHPIEARAAPRLRVRKGYIPKTHPGTYYNGPGVYVGPTVFPKAVVHPGIKPRHFEADIVKEESENVKAIIIAAVDRESQAP